MGLNNRLRQTKITPWLNLSLALMWIFIALRDIRRHSDAILAGVAALLFLTAAVTGFLKSRRNPEGKPEPAVTTLFGPR